MKTIRDIYTPHAPTPAQLFAYSETIKFNRWKTIAHPCGSITFAREATGMISASSSASGLMARLRLKTVAPVVGWTGVPVAAPVPCEPVVEGADTEGHKDQMTALRDHLTACCRAWFWDCENKRVKGEIDARKKEVASLRRKAKVLKGANGDPGKAFRDKARELGRFCHMTEVSGFRLAVWPERGHWHVAEYHTGQGFACPSTPSKEFPGDKKGLMAAVGDAAMLRIKAVGPAALLDTLSQFPVVNP